LEDQTILEAHWFGKVVYNHAWQMQDLWAQEIANGQRRPSLMLLEHPHTFTLGRRGKEENLLWNENERRRREIQVYHVDRGGDITYHGPGQLVGYPIIPLTAPGWHGDRLVQTDFLAYLRRLEKIIIFTLAEFGIAAGQREGLTGVWVQADVINRCRNCDSGLFQSPAKIASIGVKVDARGISRHGFALNVDPNMEYWQGIVPCGLNDVQMISMAELIPEPPRLSKVAEIIAGAFCEEFGYILDWDPGGPP